MNDTAKNQFIPVVSTPGISAAVRTGLRLLSREWRSGDLLAIAVAIFITIMSLVSVFAISDRVHQVLARSGSELIAADLIVSTSTPTPEEWITHSRSSGLEISQMATLRSVVVSDSDSSLAAIKLADSAYPLRGELRLMPARDSQDQAQQGGPARGEAWLDTQLMDLLGVEVGDTVNVGALALKATQIIAVEPDRGGGVFAIAPRLMMAFDDLDATELIQPGSIASHQLMVAGGADTINDWRDWIEPQLESSGQLRDASSTTPRFGNVIERAERFLALSALVGLILAGAAIARAATHFAHRHLDHVAVLRSFGVSHRNILVSYTVVLATCAVVAGILGAIAGYFSQHALSSLLPGLTQAALPSASWRPAFMGVTVALIVVVGFSIPALWQLRHVPPLRVLRRNAEAASMWRTLGLVVQMLVIVVLVLITARDFKLALGFAGGTLATIIALVLLGRCLVFVMGQAARVGRGSWRYGIASVARRPWNSVAQTTALGVGIMVLLLLTLVRSDLLENWLNQLPTDTPNHFLVNIGKDQLSGLDKFFNDLDLSPPTYAPMLRARLQRINGEVPDPANFKSAFARRSLQRAANLTWVESLSDDNSIVDGEWWTDAQHGESLLSVESDYARDLGLQVGDKLSYRLGDREIEFTVYNLRKVSWDSFRPNFFLVTPPGLLDDEVFTHIASFHVPPEIPRFRQKLMLEFPNLTDIDVDALLSRVRRVLERLNLALQYIFLFTLAAGVVVLATVIYTGISERTREVAVLRTLGTRDRPLLHALLLEYTVLGLAAGLVGALAAWCVGHVIARYLLHLAFTGGLSIVLAGVAGGLVVVGLAGWISTRQIMRVPPWTAVRR